MKRDVDLTFGLSRSIVATGTPDFDEITPNVSPACTVQNRCVDDVRVTFGFVFAARVVSTRFPGGVTLVVVRVGEPPFSRPEWINTTATVAASRNPAGAA